MTTITETQVIVVGAGPAGAAAAFFLAQAGANVLVVEQATFPRDKACGDGLNTHSIGMLARLGLTSWVQEQHFNPYLSYLLSSPDGSTAHTFPPQRPEPWGYLIPRLALDEALIRQAVAAGARLQEGTHITDLERLSAQRVRLKGTAGRQDVTLEAPLVIAADGGPVSFTRRLGLAPRSAEWVALRGYFEGDIGDPGQCEIHWERAVTPGYCWIFPTGHGRANVGIGIYAAYVKRWRLNLETMLQTFLTQNPHARARFPQPRLIGSLRGHPLRANARQVKPFTDNVLVAGEAAGVVNPLTGEGISLSMICGELAATYALRALERGDFSAAGLAAYGRAFHRRYDGLQRTARLARWVISQPWLLNRAIRRASHDETFASLMNDVIIALKSPGALLTPGAALRLLIG